MPTPSDAIIFEDVTKSYQPSEGFIGQAQRLLLSLKTGKLNRYQLRPTKFHAIKQASFRIAKTERIGFVGANGAGKSTILKLVNGTVRPTSGRVVVNGSVGGLIELSAGFNGDLSGRDNVLFKLALDGITGHKALKISDEVIDMAELRSFAKTPLKHFSSGMRVRLGFASALVSRPEIVLLDEVLAVGDVAFKQRAIGLVEEYLRDRTVLFISHNSQDIRRICNRVIVINSGTPVFDGDVSEGIDFYEKGLGRKLDVKSEKLLINEGRRMGYAATPKFEVTEVQINGQSPETVQLKKAAHQKVRIDVKLVRCGETSDDFASLSCAVRKVLPSGLTHLLSLKETDVKIEAGFGKAIFEFSTAALLPGNYSLELAPQPISASIRTAIEVARYHFNLEADDGHDDIGVVDIGLKSLPI